MEMVTIDKENNQSSIIQTKQLTTKYTLFLKVHFVILTCYFYNIDQ